MNSYEKKIQRKRWRDVRGTSDVIYGGHIGSNGEGRKGEKLPMALKRDSVQWKRGCRNLPIRWRAGSLQDGDVTGIIFLERWCRVLHRTSVAGHLRLEELKGKVSERSIK